MWIDFGFAFVRKLDTKRLGRQWHSVAFECRRRAKHPVGTVKVVQNSQKAKTFGEFEVMEIMGLRRREKWQMVAWMIVKCAKDRQRIPKPRCGNVRAHDDCALRVNSKELQKDCLDSLFGKYPPHMKDFRCHALLTSAGGKMLDKRCSSGWQYIAVTAMGAVHSWCFLWMCLYNRRWCNSLVPRQDVKLLLIFDDYFGVSGNALTLIPYSSDND